MKKAKILFIAPLPPPVHGSAVMSQHIKNCNELNNEFECEFINLSTSRNINEIGKQSFIKYIRFINIYFSVFWKLLTKNYSLCYIAITCHGIGFLKDSPFVLLCKLFRKKVLLHQHNKGMSKCVDKQPYKWLMPFVYKNTKVILLSWFLYKDIEKIVNKEQVIICPNGIHNIFDKEPYYEINKDIPHLLFLSNLIPSKGVYILLDACKILKDKGYKFICDFVGGESNEITKDKFNLAIKESNLSETIIYHGPKYDSEKENFFINADIFIHPTFEDCFPLTLIEAMQYKLPIVTTNEGAIPDIIKDGENGIICKKEDANAIANAIEILLNDKNIRLKFGINGYNMYKTKFTLQNFHKRISRIIKEEI